MKLLKALLSILVAYALASGFIHALDNGPNWLLVAYCTLLFVPISKNLFFGHE